jgi:hypothetical protein
VGAALSFLLPRYPAESSAATQDMTAASRLVAET